MILIRAIYRSFISLSGFSWGTSSALDGRRSRYRYFELEASLKCRSCKKGRYAPPVHMIKLTETRGIAPYVWVHPDEER
jgi:hypothetical protein